MSFFFLDWFENVFVESPLNTHLWLHPIPPSISDVPYPTLCVSMPGTLNLDISLWNNPFVICQTPLSVSSSCRVGLMLRCDRCLSSACTCIYTCSSSNTDWCSVLLSIREPEFCDRQAISPWWEVIALWADQFVIFFLKRQTGETHCYSSSKWFAFHPSYISLIFLASLSSKPPLLPSVCLPHSLFTSDLAFGLFISVHFSCCLQGGWDPANQGWVMLHEHSLGALRALLGWIIYTTPHREKPCVSQSHQRSCLDFALTCVVGTSANTEDIRD